MHRLAFALAVVLCVTGAACSSSGSSSGSAPEPQVETTTPLRVADLPAAVAALEKRLGGPQRYTEINATPDGVNLFVSTGEGREAPWFFRSGGGLEPPDTDGAASATPFALDGVDLGRLSGLVLDVQRRFPGSVVTSAALVQVADQGLVWALRSRSVKGGLLDVLYSLDGRTLSAGPAG